MSYKITVDEEICIGCGACTGSGNFELNDENIAVPLESEVDTIGANQDAADNCPVEAIKIEEI